MASIGMEAAFKFGCSKFRTDRVGCIIRNYILSINKEDIVSWGFAWL